MIQIRSVTKKFKNTVVLDQMSLNIEEGSVFGLIGPNGAGKSTLLRIVSGIMEPDEGCVEINGTNVFEHPEIKKDILYISDDPFYFTHANIKDMKEFYKVWYPQLNEDVYHRYVKQFKLNEKQPIKTFSKGMKRQAFIILALAIAPRYLLLDEAFDGLDPIMRLTFKRSILKMIEEKKMTILISSHNLRELEDICDTFGILEQAKISTSGNIIDTKENIHKIQLAFSQAVKEEVFANLDVMSLRMQSRVVNLVVKGNIEEIKKELQKLHPLMMEVLPVNLEEIFIYEMEKRGYTAYDE